MEKLIRKPAPSKPMSSYTPSSVGQCALQMEQLMSSRQWHTFCTPLSKRCFVKVQSLLLCDIKRETSETYHLLSSGFAAMRGAKILRWLPHDGLCDAVCLNFYQ